MIRHTRIPAIECICEALLKDGSPCRYRWFSIAKKLPENCANLDCRSRMWNGKKKRVPKPKIELPKPTRVRDYDDEF